jgi:tRNA pseudouridine55 synthase
MFGLLNLYKPAGLSSRDAVNVVQRLIRPAKVGHAGTLDPLADGVLLVTLGAATRLTEYAQRLPKRYRATFLLGQSSDTEDIEGQVVRLPHPPQPSTADLQRVLPRFLGEILQRPPAYSALKVKGQRAYRLARAGQTVDLAPRNVRIDELLIEHYAYPRLVLQIGCGAGTYVRALGRDLAQAVGTEAVLAELTRTAIGPLTVEQAVPPDQLNRQTLANYLLSPLVALGDLPRVELTIDEQGRVAHGQNIVRPDRDQPELIAISSTGQLLAILVRRGPPGCYGPKRNFSDRG